MTLNCYFVLRSAFESITKLHFFCIANRDISASLELSPPNHPHPTSPTDQINQNIMADTQADLSENAAELAKDFFNQIFGVFETSIRRFFRNLYNSFAEVNSRRWTIVIGSVVFYIIVRPYIEKFFKYLHDRQRRQEKEKKEQEKAAFGGGKAKMSANALRGGGGKVLGEVDNDDEEVEEEEEEEADLNLAMASGVPEWNQMARKRQKKYIKNLKKESGQRAEAYSEEQLMEMLDWSEDEEKKKET